MNVTVLPEVNEVRGKDGRVDTAEVVREGMKNARAVGTERDGKVFVQNAYTGRELRIDTASIRHGLNGSLNRLLTNARLGAAIGDVVKDAVPINALQNKADGVSGTYAMAAYATDNRGREFVSIVTVEQRSGDIASLEAYDVTHSVSGRQNKRSERVDTKSQGVNPSTNASNIKISDFLNVVKNTHQSVLSQNVLDEIGEERNPAGYYTGKAKFSADDTTATPQENDKAALPEVSNAPVPLFGGGSRRRGGWDDHFHAGQHSEEGAGLSAQGARADGGGHPADALDAVCGTSGGAQACH